MDLYIWQPMIFIRVCNKRVNSWGSYVCIYTEMNINLNLSSLIAKQVLYDQHARLEYKNSCLFITNSISWTLHVRYNLYLIILYWWIIEIYWFIMSNISVVHHTPYISIILLWYVVSGIVIIRFEPSFLLNALKKTHHHKS